MKDLIVQQYYDGRFYENQILRLGIFLPLKNYFIMYLIEKKYDKSTRQKDPKRTFMRNLISISLLTSGVLLKTKSTFSVLYILT